MSANRNACLIPSRVRKVVISWERNDLISLSGRIALVSTI
jgi:hypothetical protein